jgi:hypothetical protein
MAQQLNLDTILNSMIAAAEGSLKENWPAISTLAIASLKTLAQNIVYIEGMNTGNAISPAQASILIDMQKNAVKTVLLSEEGLGLVTAEAAINAVIDVIRVPVNTALGWALL